MVYVTDIFSLGVNAIDRATTMIKFDKFFMRKIRIMRLKMKKIPIIKIRMGANVKVLVHLGAIRKP